MIDDQHEELGPLLIAPPAYFDVRRVIRSRLGFPIGRAALLIGIDGEDGSGKSSLAAWLSWQLEMPAIHLDIYLTRSSGVLDWRLDDLQRAINGAQRIPKRRPVIVEGVSLLSVLGQFGRSPDLHIFVEKAGHVGNMRNELRLYLEDASVRADYVLKWSSESHDARVQMAHANYDNVTRKL